jgi:hypothetical protein
MCSVVNVLPLMSSVLQYAPNKACAFDWPDGGVLLCRNEPDVFEIPDEAFGKPWMPGGYIQAYGTVAQRLAAAYPSIKRYGPSLCNAYTAAQTNFTVIAKARPGMTEFSQHHYAFGKTSNFTTTTTLLERTIQHQMFWLRPIFNDARAAGLPLRMTEIGSCSLGGVRNVSDTFAVALWTLDFMFELHAVGLTGVNWHGGAVNIPPGRGYAFYTYFMFRRGSTAPIVFPNYYALALWQVNTVAGFVLCALDWS